MALLCTQTQPTGAKTEQHNRRSQGQLQIKRTKEAQAKKGHKVRHPKEKGLKTHKTTTETIKKLARALKSTETRNNGAEADQFFAEF